MDDKGTLIVLIDTEIRNVALELERISRMDLGRIGDTDIGCFRLSAVLMTLTASRDILKMIPGDRI